jgi:signal transduction histidine kinase
VADRLTEKNVQLVRELDDALGEMMLDPRELQKLLLNLVLNAIDAMEAGGTLTVRTRRVADAVEISVEDTGMGMDEETRARMFDLFFSTKANGTGLGMAIVRSVIDRHGGRLEVDTAPGAGTRMRVTLPIVTP